MQWIKTLKINKNLVPVNSNVHPICDIKREISLNYKATVKNIFLEMSVIVNKQKLKGYKITRSVFFFLSPV